MDGEMWGLVAEALWRLAVLVLLCRVCVGIDSLVDLQRFLGSHSDREAITKRSRGDRQ